MQTPRQVVTRRDVVKGAVALGGSATLTAALARSLGRQRAFAHQAAGAGPAGFGVLNTHSIFDDGISSANVGQLGLAWSIPTEQPVTHVPLPDGAQVYFADWGGTVSAADIATGQIVWQNTIEQPMTMWPWHGFAGPGALADGVLFEASVEGTAFALDAASGDVIWQTSITDDQHAGSLAQPLFFDGLIYFGLQSVEEPLAKMMPDFQPDFQGKVLALNAETGETIWERFLVEPPHNGVPVWGGFALDPALNLLYFTTGNNYTGEPSELSDAIVAVNAQTGEIVWAYQATGQDVWTPATPIGPDLDFGAGPQLFEATIDGQVRQLVGAGQKSGVYWALDRATGEVLWNTVVGLAGVGGGIRGDASVGIDRILAWSNNSWDDVGPPKPPEQYPIDVKALDPATGAYLWVQPKSQPAIGTAAGYLANDVYFVGSLDGTIQAYAADDGRVLWSTKLPAAVGSSLVVMNDTLYVGSGVPRAFGGGPGTNGVWAFRLGATGTPPAGAATAVASPMAAATPTPEGASAAQAETVTIETHSFFFDPDRIVIPANTDMAFVITNPSDVEHSFTVPQLGINVEVHAGETKSLSVNAPAGEYPFHCEYHPDRMQGTLIAE